MDLKKQIQEKIATIKDGYSFDKEWSDTDAGKISAYKSVLDMLEETLEEKTEENMPNFCFSCGEPTDNKGDVDGKEEWLCSNCQSVSSGPVSDL